MFFEDALTVSRELELVLTGKNCGLEERAPMCGIPHHAAAAYIPRLINKGYIVVGNSVVLKPATQGSLCGLYLAKVFQEAGVPNGVLNTITGKGSEIG